MEENTFVIIDQNNVEKEMEILFTFDHDEQNYVVFKEVNAETDDFFVGKYDEEGVLDLDLSQAEFEMCEEIFNTFLGESDA